MSEPSRPVSGSGVLVTGKGVHEGAGGHASREPVALDKGHRGAGARRGNGGSHARRAGAADDNAIDRHALRPL